MKPSLKLNSIGQVAIPVHDLDRAVAFYRDSLGLKFLFQFPNIAFFDCGGVRLMLSIPEKPEFDHPASIIYYKVDEIQPAWDALIAKGIEGMSPPHLVARMPDHELWMAFFHDPDRNVLALMCEIAPAT